MKKFAIVSFVLLISLFGAPLHGGESSGEASSSGASSSSSGGGASFPSLRTDAQKNTLMAKLCGLLDEMRLFKVSLDRSCYQLGLIELDLLHNPAAAAELEFVHILQKVHTECYRNFIDFPLIEGEPRILHNLQVIAKFLHNLALAMKNYGDIRLYHVRSLVNSFFHARLFDETLALILGISCQESWEVDDVFMHELMVRAARLPECAVLAGDCERSYHAFFHSTAISDVVVVDVGVLFFEQLAELLDGMISRFKN